MVKFSIIGKETGVHYTFLSKVENSRHTILHAKAERSQNFKLSDSVPICSKEPYFTVYMLKS
jgi:hypothetical protein